ncbi:YeiH family protein [Chloroflexota bacterium]
MEHTAAAIAQKPIAASTKKEHLNELFPGLLLTLVFAAAAFATWWLLKDTWLKFSALMWAFIYSIIASNLFPRTSHSSFTAGINFCSTRMLRWAIALLGLTISASVWSLLGGLGTAAVLINLPFVLVFGFIFCRYVLKLDSSLAVLLGAGTGVCGATAIAAVGPAIKAKTEEMGLAVGAITLFGLLAMFGYPLLFSGPLGSWLGNDPTAYGLWAGMGVHETAQVIAAGSQIDGALAVAVSAKFIRIFMIGPVIFISLMIFRKFSSKTAASEIKQSIPWFAVIFIVFTVLHWGLTTLPIRDAWLNLNGNLLKPAITFVMAWSFAAVGFKVKLSTIRAMGPKAIIGGIVVALMAGSSALLLTKFLFMGS